MTRIIAVIVEGEADEATQAMLRQAMESTEHSVVFAAPRVEEIIERVAYETGLSVTEIIGPRKNARLMRARWAVSLLAKRLTTKSAVQIGRAMGGRDHSTILVQMKRGEEMLDHDPALSIMVSRIARHFDRRDPA